MNSPMTEQMKQDIVVRASSLIARAADPIGLLSLSDLEALTGFDKRGKTIHNMVTSYDFPRPVMVGTRENRWFSADVFRWLEQRRF